MATSTYTLMGSEFPPPPRTLPAQLVYDIWTPSLGTDSNAHMVLPNSTNTNIFCGGQGVLWGLDEVLTVGGGQQGSTFRVPNSFTTLFSPPSNTIQSGPQMEYPRWYPTIVAQPDGEMLVLGGRLDLDTTPAITPEIYSSSTGWRALD